MDAPSKHRADGGAGAGGERKPARGPRLVGALSIAIGALVLLGLATATVGANLTARASSASDAQQSLPVRLSAALGRASAQLFEWRTGTPAGSASPADLAATAQWIVVGGALVGAGFVACGLFVRRRA